MKISEFAKKFDIGVNTARYYVSCGLLLPEVRNKQFRFDDRCVRDMEMILLLKRFDFSIAEIQSILSLTRLSNLTAADDVADLIRILEEKYNVLSEKLEQSKLALQELEKFTKSVKKQELPAAIPHPQRGIPVEMLPLLCCPDCGSTLSLLNADIQSGQIVRAEVTCSCGYHATIQNGILITEGGYISELDSPDLDRKFYKDLPVSWVTMFQKAFNWMLNQFSAMDLKGKVVMENHINCYFFLFARLSDLDESTYYILTDKYPQIVALFKKLIERQNPNLKILYIADSSYRYPLKKECVDLYVDFHSLNEYSIFDNKQDVFEIMRPYLRRGADVLGTYFYFSPHSPSQRKLLQEYPVCAPSNFQIGHFRDAAKTCKLTCLQEEEIGSVTEWGGKNRNFIYHVKNDSLHLLSYHYRAE